MVLNHLFNMLGYNANGREGPDVSQQVRDEGYLFYIAWATHDSENLFNIADAHSSLRPVTVGGACNAISALAQQNLGGNEFILGLTGRCSPTRALCG